MMNDEEKLLLYKEVYNKLFNDSKYDLKKMDYPKKYSYIKKVLIDIINNDNNELNNCDSYNYIYQITKFVEHYGWGIEEILIKIKYDIEIYKKEKDHDINLDFTVTYALAVLYFRYNELNKMNSILSTNKYKSYVLYYELLTRYCLAKNFSNKAYNLALFCTDLYKEKYTDKNLHEGLKVTYVSATSKCIEKYILEYEKHIEQPFLEVNKHNINQDEDKVVRIINDTFKEKNIETRVNEILFKEKGLEIIKKAIDYINDAIKKDSNYPKYYYLKSQILYYLEKINEIKEISDYKNELTENSLEVINKCLEVLENNKNDKDYEIRKRKYLEFKNIIDNENKNKMKSIYYNKRVVILSADINSIKWKNILNIEKNPNKVFVSYSSKDYKSVFCDLIELHAADVNIDVDTEMNIDTKNIDYKAREQWYNIIEEKIKNSKCVICYISENFITSEAVLHEIKLIEKYNKPTILVDLTGKILISHIIKDIYMNSPEKTLSSEILKWYIELFSDSTITIKKGKTIDYTNHIDMLISKIEDIAPLAINNVRSENESIKRKDSSKVDQNEDYCLTDDINKVYVLVDGISRSDRADYNNDKELVSNLSKKFSQTFMENYKSEISLKTNHKEMINLIKDSFEEGNNEVKKYNETLDLINEEAPGCVGVLCGIFKGYLYYGYFGDCSLFIIRDETRIILGDNQTRCAFEVFGEEKNRMQLENIYINKKYKYGYCVANGDPDAKDNLKTGYIKLEVGDIIFMCSDGISEYLLNADPLDYKNKPIKEIFLNGQRFKEEVEIKKKNIDSDNQFEKIKYDDRTIIRIEYGH